MYRLRRYPHLIPLLGLGLAFALFAARGWGRWGDELTDAGQAPYYAWRILNGAVLYRDLQFFFGPLIQYWNALLFWIFGVSLLTLNLAMLALLAGIGAMIYGFFSEFSSRFDAFFCALVAFAVFGFAQYGYFGIFNFIHPYQYEVGYGMAFSIAAVWLEARRQRRSSIRSLLAIGGLWGLVFLTKVEILVALSAALVGGGLLRLILKQLTPRQAITELLWLGLGGLLPLLLVFLYFVTQLSGSEAVRAVAGGILPMLEGKIATGSFALSGMGLDHPWDNLRITATSGLLSLLASLALGWSWHWLGKQKRWELRALAVIFSISLFVTLTRLSGWRPPWDYLVRGMPVLVLVATGLLLAQMFGRSRDLASWPRRYAIWIWTCFSAALLGKMLLKAQVTHYGFYLGLPAGALLVHFQLSMLPEFWAKRVELEWWERLGFFAPFLAGMVFYGTITLNVSGYRSFPIGSGGDTFQTFPAGITARGEGVAETLRFLSTLPKEQTLMVLPEGVMINYLSRRVNPTPFTLFTIGELETYGESQILAAIQKAPPDLIVLAHKDTREFGVGYFGQDARYGQKILSWVSANYKTLMLKGPEPFAGRFGIKILAYSPTSQAAQPLRPLASETKR